LRMQDFNFAQI